MISVGDKVSLILEAKERETSLKMVNLIPYRFKLSEVFMRNPSRLILRLLIAVTGQIL